MRARAKKRSGAALCALLNMGAKDVAVIRDGIEARIPTGQRVVGDVLSVRPEGKGRNRWHPHQRDLSGRCLDADR